MRQAAAVALAAVIAAVAALVLGEYELSVVAGIVAGVLVGLALAEATLAVLRSPARTVVAAVAVLAAGAMVWAGFITVRHRDEAIPAAAWVGAAAGAAAVWLRAGSARSGGSGSPTGR